MKFQYSKDLQLTRTRLGWIGFHRVSCRSLENLNFKGFFGFYWILLESQWFFLILFDFIGISNVFVGLYLILLEFQRFLLVFIGLYWNFYCFLVILLDFIGFSKVLLDFVINPWNPIQPSRVRVSCRSLEN